MNAFLYYDVRMGRRFGGSCGLVAHSICNSLKKLGYKVRGRLYPVTDKISQIQLSPFVKPSNKDVRFFFEELFPRAERSQQFSRAKNISFFNLYYTGELTAQLDADQLLFNSEYLMSCYRNFLFSKGISTLPQLGCIPLALPLLEFPNGYCSSGYSLPIVEIRNLAGSVYLGHALRRQKIDHFATLSILYHLNAHSKLKGNRPFWLVVPELEMPNFVSAQRSVGLPVEVLEYLNPVPHLNNRTITAIMKNSHFGLCYDQVVEAFGFYPIESVYCKSPIFTNGSGNLRHLLPKDHGITVQETLNMHFGSIDARIAAYKEVARSIFEKVTSGKGQKECIAGSCYIEKRYCEAAFTKALQKRLRIPKSPSLMTVSEAILAPSPFLRLADWRRGQFVTDDGNIKLDTTTGKYFQKLLTRKISISDYSKRKIDHRVLGVKS